MATPELRYLTTSDGVRIAYAVHGSGPPLLFVRGWMSHIELQWEEPAYRRFFEALGSAYTVIRYDIRGNGRSARDVLDRLTLDDLVLDIEAVVDWLDVADPVIWATCYGGPIAARYLRRHPQGATRLVLDGSAARFGETDGTVEVPMLRLMDRDPAAAQVQIAHATNPEPGGLGADVIQRYRATMTNDVGNVLYTMAYLTDFTDDMAAIEVPTLVIHRRDSQAVPFKCGRELAATVPGARFVGLDGAAHNPWAGDAAAVLDTVGAFLGVGFPELGEITVPTLDTAVILFTDIVGSTHSQAHLGDEKAQARLQIHDRIIAAALDRHRGQRVKGTGDGVMAAFTSVSQALAAAGQIQLEHWARNQASRDDAVHVRIGLNAGEPVAIDGDLHGLVVATAARACNAAEPDQILVTNVVRELAGGKGFTFTDVGEHDLKGLDGPVRLYAMEWR